MEAGTGYRSTILPSGSSRQLGHGKDHGPVRVTEQVGRRSASTLDEAYGNPAIARGGIAGLLITQ
jgi:hypothetical protein